MTAIAAVVQDGKVTMGADSQGSNSYTKTMQAQAKIFRFGPAMIGVCGSIRVSNVLQAMPAPEAFEANLVWIIREYIPSVFKALEEAKALKVENGIAELAGSELLIGIQGHLFTVQNDLGVQEHAKPYAATGSGEQIALGVLAATVGLQADERVRMALTIAAEHTPWVGGRQDILHAG